MSEVSPRGALKISFGEVCDRGKVREENQDNVRTASLPLGELFIVADGIGGYQGGATASRMVVDGFHSQLAIKPAAYPPDQALQEACNYTNSSIHTAANTGNPATQKMGSTVVLALIQTSAASTGNAGPMAWIGHVGDSRAYLIRAGRLQKITSDHSAVQALLSRNLITEEEARNHPDASVLTRSLGHRPEVEIEIDPVPLQAGDALLLCSDGLWGYVAEEDIAAVATNESLSVQTIADTLLRLALDAGGQDNIGIEYIRLQGTAGASVPPVPISYRGVAASAPPFPPKSASRVEAKPAPPPMTRARKQQLAAIALILLAGVGGLGLTAYTKGWFKGLSGGASAGTGDASKKLVVIGDRPETWQRTVIANAVEWKNFHFAHGDKPRCVSEAADAITIYGVKASTLGPTLLVEIEKQYPDLKLETEHKIVEYRDLTPQVQQACGPESYDVVVVMPKLKAAPAVTPTAQPKSHPAASPANPPASGQSGQGPANAAQKSPEAQQTADQQPGGQPPAKPPAVGPQPKPKPHQSDH